MASTDSRLAESMNAHVLTTSTSASEASCVSSWPASRASPSITSESTRFLGQPREIRPIFIFGYKALHHGERGGTEGKPPPRWRCRVSRVEPVQHTRVRDRFAYMLQAADPGDDAL